MSKVVDWLTQRSCKVVCIAAMALAVVSVNSTCAFVAYQPDVPSKFYNNYFFEEDFHENQESCFVQWLSLHLQ